MRNYLTNIDITGAVLCYQEGEQIRWSLNWLYINCDRVCIVLDNWDEKTKKIVLEYKNKHPERTHIAYSDVAVVEEKNKIQGQIKKRFKHKQAQIREFVLQELKKMHQEKPIDLLIWPDSDETFINEFSKHLERFWNSSYEFMVLGFVEVYDSMRILMSQEMGPHGRVYKYTPEMTVYPWVGRTRYHPHISSAKKPWKLRHMVVHVCHLTEEYRQRRKFFDNENFEERHKRRLWFLPKDVRQMTSSEIADYQLGPHGRAAKMPSILLEEYLNNKSKYEEYTLWT